MAVSTLLASNELVLICVPTLLEWFRIHWRQKSLLPILARYTSQSLNSLSLTVRLAWGTAVMLGINRMDSNNSGDTRGRRERDRVLIKEMNGVTQ